MSLVRRVVERLSRRVVAVRPHFGLLSYTTNNLGDFMQSVAARRFLPRIDRYIDRENLDEARSPDGRPIKLIMNGWYCHRPDKWPPASCIAPLLISVHITNNPEPGSGMRAREQFARMPQVLDYLRQHAPVGARDQSTLEWLQAHDVEAYYSGCLTLTLERPAVSRQPFIVLNDVSDAVARRVEAATARPIRRPLHDDAVTVGIEARVRRAERLIETYAEACCVLTTRLHGALPCLAMGTPVLLVDESWDQSRFTGIEELVHRCSTDRFVAGEVAYDLDNPPPNPIKHWALRQDLEKRVAAFIAD